MHQLRLEQFQLQPHRAQFLARQEIGVGEGQPVGRRAGLRRVGMRLAAATSSTLSRKGWLRGSSFMGPHWIAWGFPSAYRVGPPDQPKRETHVDAALEAAIEAAWEARDGISPATKGETRDAIEATLTALDSRHAAGGRKARRTGM
jgi:hypothetical protein